jgi:DNA-binding transcriptional ArsR family regulator
MNTFSALAEPNRLKIVEMLAKKGEMSATDISKKFKISPPAVSQHLKVLRVAKLVDMEKRAQQRIYKINKSAINELDQWINELKKQWDQRFLRLEKVLEREKRKGVTKK